MKVKAPGYGTAAPTALQPQEPQEQRDRDPSAVPGAAHSNGGHPCGTTWTLESIHQKMERA